MNIKILMSAVIIAVSLGPIQSLAQGDTADNTAIEAAQQAMDRWRPDLAVAQLKASPQEDKAQWHRLMGVNLAQLGEDGDRAMDHLEKAVALTPDEAENHWTLVAGLSSQFNEAGALGAMRLARQLRDSLETAVELDPDNPEYRYGLMQYYIEAPRLVGGSSRKARAQSERIRALDSDWGAAAEALMLFDDGDNEAGQEKLLAAWKQGNGIEAIAMDLVFRLQSQEDWTNAQQVLEQWLARKPGHPGALYQLGRTAAFSSHELEAGKAALREYIDLEFIAPYRPSRAAAYWRLGQIHEHESDWQAARIAHNKALELDPDFEDAQASLAALPEGETTDSSDVSAK